MTALPSTMMTMLSPPPVMMTTDERRETLTLFSALISIIPITKFVSECLVAESDSMPKLRQVAIFWLR